MTPFRRARGGYSATWTAVERAVFASVAREVAGLLRSQIDIPEHTDDPLARALSQATGPRQEPTDPAIQRLLPDSSVDPTVASEFRHLTQADIASAKVSGLDAFAALLDAPTPGVQASGMDATTLVVPDSAAPTVATALTDIRLVLAQRLGLTTDDEVDRLHMALEAGSLEGDPALGLDADTQRYWAGVLIGAGFAQETLVGAMLEEHRARRGR